MNCRYERKPDKLRLRPGRASGHYSRHWDNTLHAAEGEHHPIFAMCSSCQVPLCATCWSSLGSTAQVHCPCEDQEEFLLWLYDGDEDRVRNALFGDSDTWSGW